MCLRNIQIDFKLNISLNGSNRDGFWKRRRFLLEYGIIENNENALQYQSNECAGCIDHKIIRAGPWAKSNYTNATKTDIRKQKSDNTGLQSNFGCVATRARDWYFQKCPRCWLTVKRPSRESRQMPALHIVNCDALLLYNKNRLRTITTSDAMDSLDWNAVAFISHIPLG